MPVREAIVVNKTIVIAAAVGLAGFGALAFGFADKAKPVTGVVTKVVQATPVEWEHGFKTDRVVATRYNDPSFGYNIGFRYLDLVDDSKADTTKVVDFFKRNGCGIMQGGGSPFSQYFVACDDVTDRASANVKLKTLLPALDEFIRTVS